MTSTQHEAALTQADLAFAESTGNADIAWTTQVAAAGKAKKTTLAAHEKTYKLAVANAQKNLSQGLAYADEATSLAQIPIQVSAWAAQASTGGARYVAEAQAIAGFRAGDYTGKVASWGAIDAAIGTPWTHSQSADASARASWWATAAGPAFTTQAVAETVADANYEAAVDAAFADWKSTAATVRRNLDLAAVGLANALSVADAEGVYAYRVAESGAEQDYQLSLANQRKQSGLQEARLAHGLPLAPLTTPSNPSDPAWTGWLSAQDAQARSQARNAYDRPDLTSQGTLDVNAASANVDFYAGYRDQFVSYATLMAEAEQAFGVVEAELNRQREDSIAQSRGELDVAYASSWATTISARLQTNTNDPWIALESAHAASELVFVNAMVPATVTRFAAENLANRDTLSAAIAANRVLAESDAVQNADAAVADATAALTATLRNSQSSVAQNINPKNLTSLVPTALQAELHIKLKDISAHLAQQALSTDYGGSFDREPFKTPANLPESVPAYDARHVGSTVVAKLVDGLTRQSPEASTAVTTPTETPDDASTPTNVAPEQKPLPRELKAAVKEKINRWLDHGFNKEEAEDFKNGFYRAIQDALEGYANFVSSAYDYYLLAWKLSIPLGASLEKYIPGQMGEDIRARTARAERSMAEAAREVGKAVNVLVTNPQLVREQIQRQLKEAKLVAEVLAQVGGVAAKIVGTGGGRLATAEADMSAARNQLRELLIKLLDSLPDEAMPLVSNTFTNPYAQGYFAGTVFVFLVEEAVGYVVTLGVNKLWTATNMTMRLSKLGEKLAQFSDRIDDVIDRARNAGQLTSAASTTRMITATERARLEEWIAASKKGRDVKLKGISARDKQHWDDLVKQLERQAPNSVPTQIKNLGDDVSRWMGKDAKVITNPAGDTIIQSADGLREIRLDFNHTYPHKNPHIHLIEYKMVKNKKVEITNRRIYPSGVTPE